MPAQSSLTLNTKPYAPRGVSNGIANWALAGDTTFGGATSTLTESVRSPLSDGSNATRWVLTVPKAAVTDTACVCAGGILGTAKADLKLNTPATMTLAERQDFVDRVQALVALAVFDQSVSVPEPSW